MPRSQSASEPSSPSPRRAVRQTQEERRQTTEKRLLDMAARSFALHGVDQSTLAQIGELAGYSNGLVNHRFGSKAALVQALAHRTQDEFTEQVGVIDGDAVDQIAAMAHIYLDRLAQQLDSVHSYLVMWGAAMPSEAALRPLFAEFDAEFRDIVAGEIRSGQRAKTIRRSANPAATAAAILGLIRGIAGQYLIDPVLLDLGDLTATCEQMIRRSLTP